MNRTLGQVIARLESVSSGAVILFMTLTPIIAISIWLSEAVMSPDGWAALRWGTDFVPMWLSSTLYSEGGAAMLFDSAAMAERQAAYTRVDGVLLWHYPPTYQLLVEPFGRLSFFGALMLFSTISLGIWTVTTRQFVPFKGLAGILFLIASPAITVCVLQGQNGLITASLLGLALILRERERLWLAAALIAVLLAKPHLGLAVPVALLAARDLKLFGMISVLGLGFIGITLVTYGHGVWFAFLGNTQTVSLALQSGDLWSQQPTIYAFMSLAGAGHDLSIIAQSIVSLAVAGWLWTVWRRDGPASLRIAALLTATLLLTPFCFRYDMGVSLLGLALLARHMATRGWKCGDRLLLAGLWVVPALMPGVADATHVQIGAIALFVQTLLIDRELRNASVPRGCEKGKGGASAPPSIII